MAGIITSSALAEPLNPIAGYSYCQDSSILKRNMTLYYTLGNGTNSNRTFSSYTNCTFGCNQLGNVCNSNPYSIPQVGVAALGIVPTIFASILFFVLGIFVKRFELFQGIFITIALLFLLITFTISRDIAGKLSSGALPVFFDQGVTISSYIFYIVLAFMFLYFTFNSIKKLMEARKEKKELAFGDME